MTLLGYHKYTQEELETCISAFENHPSLRITDLQLYIPLYRNFFQFNDKIAKYTTLNHTNRLLKVLDEGDNPKDISSKNHYMIQIWNHNREKRENKPAFFKFSPLMDPTKYMIGKYENLQSRTEYDIYRLPSFYEGQRSSLDNSQKTSKKIDSVHNSAYVDGFFCYLSSAIKQNYGFIHGIDFYGSFLGVHQSFAYDIMDDIDYLDDSEHFHQNKSTFNDTPERQSASKFVIDSRFYEYDEDDSRKNRKPLILKENTDSLSISSFNDEIFDGLFKETQDISNETFKLLWNDQLPERDISGEHGEKGEKEDREETTSIESSDTEEEEDSEEEVSETESLSSKGSQSSSNSDDTENTSDSDTENSETNEQLWAHIKNFPVNVICLERMEGTLDDLMEDDSLDTQEWISCLAQVVFQLIVYQKMVSFTHNDLHTNNIMYTTTERKYIYYRFNERIYRIPTHGRIYKIIDFGRAIYSVNGQRICSDSYHIRGDAASQYNTEPFYNPSKPRIEPNPAFDLARLGCSLYDYFIDEDEQKYVAPLEKMIIDWCCDDSGKNLLYFSNGDERYPGFKLYKMIARKCSKNTPRAQLERSIFNSFAISKKKIPKSAHRTIFNIDTLPILS
jgi:hypothetical protein